MSLPAFRHGLRHDGVAGLALGGSEACVAALEEHPDDCHHGQAGARQDSVQLHGHPAFAPPLREGEAGVLDEAGKVTIWSQLASGTSEKATNLFGPSKILMPMDGDR